MFFGIAGSHVILTKYICVKACHGECRQIFLVGCHCPMPVTFAVHL